MDAPAPLTLFEIDPLTDARWQHFVERHPQGSVFHGTGWLRALAITYGYKPVAFTTSRPGVPLANAIVFCEVDSWLTGRRFVSLPFTDYCPPLISTGPELDALLSALRMHARIKQSRFVEIRGGAGALTSNADFCNVSARYVTHSLCLEPSLDEIFARFHPSCIRRAIRHAQKKDVRIECGRSDALMAAFYRLLAHTRRRHGLPPQPFNWFKNLVASMGDQICIRVAFLADRPVAAIVTLTTPDSAAYKSMIYKYGASDESLHKLGAVPLLMWSAIRDAKARGLSVLEFGRTDLDDKGLIQFKARFGAIETPLWYHRIWSGQHPTSEMQTDSKVVRALLRKLPISVVQVFGRLLYRHVG